MIEHIDHEAAKAHCECQLRLLAKGVSVRKVDANAYRTLLDLSAQLEAERKRTRRLAELVRRAYNDGFSAGLDEYSKHDGGTVWFDSKAKAELARIMGDSPDGD